ncbi:MAG: hypothetical protein IPJ79_08855 [Bacteroidetes bacterium]|nr:hypothetical protein [Bacteroidota bacterium]
MTNGNGSTTLNNIGRYYDCNLSLSAAENDTLIVCVESGQTTGSVTLIAKGGTEPYIYGGDATTNLSAK